MENRLKETRESIGYTQVEVAIKLGITDRHYKSLEAGESDGSMKIWQQLAKLFNCTIDYLLKQEDTKR